MTDRSRLIIAGVSSYLGRRFIDRVLPSNAWQICGLYRTASEELDTLIDACVAAGSRREWFSLCDFDADPRSHPSLEPMLPAPEVPLSFVYMCGAWHHGHVSEHRAAEVARIMNVGLLAPICCCAEIFRLRAHASAPTRCVVITGIGGERAGVHYCSLYGSVIGGIYNFIRAAAMDLAATRMSCAGLALGLFDKGQPYIRQLCADLVTGAPTSLADVLDTLQELALSYRAGANGSVIEVAGGLGNYQHTAEWLIAKETRA